ncbi:MAG TPA: branched-chain amino acid ABC transporter permease, partial [Ilumatobacteraceae bacterium]
MRGRPQLHTSYASETSMLPTWTQRIAALLLLAAAILLPFDLPVINQVPLVRFLGDADWLRLLTQAVIFAVAALGLNLLSGVAGQVSLGHAFFMGAGAYAAVVLGGESSANLWGLGLPIWIWLPGAGICAALIGILVAPTAVRVRGLYLGIVTVGLVFIGIHLSKVFPEISGGAEVGRTFPPLEFKWWKEEEPVISFATDGHWLWFDVTKNQKTYLFTLAFLILAVIVSKNLIRTRTGRALQAIRDRDVAA